MKNQTLLAIVFLWFLTDPSPLRARASQESVNSRYSVESVRVSGVPDSKISKKLAEDLQKMVGEKIKNKGR